MMPSKNAIICPYYIKGQCKFGKKCKNIHPDIINPQTNQNVPVCTFFLKDKCTKNKNCHYFHGYSNILEHVNKIVNHNSNINNLLNMDESKFISSDEKTFYVGFSGNENPHEETIAQDYKIGKLIYSSEKVICAIEKGM
jgi:hypothetical protein